VLSTVCIAAGGAVMQHIMNQEEDEIKQPKHRLVGTKISEAAAYNWYIGLTIVGVGIGFYLANVIYKPTFASLFVLVATLLYVQATNLKQIPLLGNCITALLVAISIAVIALFDIFPASDISNKVRMSEVFGILIDYAVLGFGLTLIKELLRDLKNRATDDMLGNNTVVTRFGLNKAKSLLGVIIVVVLGAILYYCNTFLFELTIALSFILLTMVGPLLFMGIKLITSTTQKEFALLERTLQVVLFCSILSVAVIVYTLKHA
jgi:4-hydroxybenzoate polyprenyltransferase